MIKGNSVGSPSGTSRPAHRGTKGSISALERYPRTPTRLPRSRRNSRTSTRTDGSDSIRGSAMSSAIKSYSGWRKTNWPTASAAWKRRNNPVLYRRRTTEFSFGRPPSSAVTPTASTEDRLDRLPLLVGEQVPVPPAHLVGLMSHKLVNDPLIHSSRRQIRGKGMPQYVESSHPHPLAPLEAAPKRLRSESLAKRLVDLLAESVSAAGMHPQPLQHRFGQQCAHRDAAVGLSRLVLLLLTNEDGLPLEIEVFQS